MRTLVVAIALLGCKSESPPTSQPPAQESPQAPAAPSGPDLPPPPRSGPHPDYPTPMAAGTDKIFLLEEPDRGPKAPVTFDWKPLAAGARWTTHSHCLDDTVDMTCSDRASPANWRVGRKGKELVVAIPASPRDDTHVFVAKPDGTPVRHLSIDPYGRVRAAKTFVGDRFTARALDGSNDLDGCGAMAFELDAKGRSAVVKCLQWSGEPMTDTDGVARRHFVRDARGFVTSARYDDLAGKPTPNIFGYAYRKRELDRDGRELVVRYYDAAEQPIESTSGCHGYRYERLPNGALAKEICIGLGGAPKNAVNGVAITTYKNDARGCRTGWRYRDADGDVTTGDDELIGKNLEVDASCAETSRTCIGEGDKPTLCGIERPSKYVTKRDRHGNALSVFHYGVTGKPAGDDEYGVFEVRFTYDELGRYVTESCHGEDGAGLECGTTGIHLTRSRYDDAGRIVEERFYNEDGDSATNMGTSIRRFVYDNYDHQYEETNHDASGVLMEMKGQAIRRDLYDAAHRTFGILMLDKTGSPAMYEGCYTGVTCPAQWHAVRIVRRTDGKAVENQYFDLNGQLIYTVKCSEASCFD